ncbi:hypothetical protein EMCRGX_G000729 [Ephydatia muelleri]
MMDIQAITSPSNGCNDLYPLEFAVQLLNGTRHDLLDEIISVWRSVNQKRPTYAEGVPVGCRERLTVWRECRWCSVR